MTFFDGNCLSDDACSVFKFRCLIDGSIYGISQRVFIDGISTCHRNILGWHGCRHSCPTIESIPFLSWCFGSGDGCTIDYGFSLEGCAIQDVSQLVRVCGERTCYRYIMQRHDLGYFTPSAEGVAFLDWSGKHFYRVTEGYHDTFVLCTVNHIDNIEFIILVDGITSCKGQVLCGHGSRHFTPSAEVVTGLGRNFGSRYRCTVSHCLCLERLTVQYVCYLVTVGSECTRYGYIACRHSCRYLTPTTESMTFFGGSGFSDDVCSVFKFRCLIDSSIYGISQRVFVDGITTCHRNILGWHGCRHSCPSAEGISFPSRCFGSGDSCTIDYGFSLEGCTIQDVSQLVRVCGERTCDGYIACRHSCRYFAPSTESMTFFGGYSFGYDVCSIFKFNILVLCTIYHI